MSFIELEERNIPLCPLHQARSMRLTIGGWLEISCDRCGGKVWGLSDWCAHVHNLYIKLEARSVNPVHAPPPEPVSRPSGASGGTKVAPQPVEPPREPEKADSRPPGEGPDPLAEIADLQRQLIWSNGRISDLYNRVADLLKQGGQFEQRLTFIEGVHSELRSREVEARRHVRGSLDELRRDVGGLRERLNGVCVERLG